MDTNECLSGGNCSYIVRLSVRDLHGPTVSMTDCMRFLFVSYKSSLLCHLILSRGLENPFLNLNNYEVLASSLLVGKSM